jgi:hypothetical protein
MLPNAFLAQNELRGILNVVQVASRSFAFLFPGHRINAKSAPLIRSIREVLHLETSWRHNSVTYNAIIFLTQESKS